MPAAPVDPETDDQYPKRQQNHQYCCQAKNLADCDRKRRSAQVFGRDADRAVGLGAPVHDLRQKLRVAAGFRLQKLIAVKPPATDGDQPCGAGIRRLFRSHCQCKQPFFSIYIGKVIGAIG